MTPLFGWGLLLLLGLATLRYLPFINVDLAFRLQLWLRNVQRRLEEELEELKREDRP